MSRGLGKKQQAVVRLIKKAEGEMTFETIRWLLYEEATTSRSGILPTAWNTSVLRAVESLKDRGLVKITLRRLSSFEECASHYPGKALQHEKYTLRKRFLPMLLQWSHDLRGVSPKYGDADNEKFHLARLPKSSVEQLSKQWHEIEELLRPIYGRATKYSAELLYLICKGRHLFCDNCFEIHTSLKMAIDSVVRHKAGSDRLLSLLRSFYEAFISDYQAGTLKLKSYIHSIAELPRHGRGSLTLEALKYLHEVDKKYVENMVGFEKCRKREPHELFFESDASKISQYPPALKTILDQTVFQEFSFISLVDLG